MAKNKKIRTTGNAGRRQMRIAKKMAIRDGGIYGYRVQKYCRTHGIDEREMFSAMTMRQKMEMLKNYFHLPKNLWYVSRDEVSFFEDGSQWEYGFYKTYDSDNEWYPYEAYGYESDLIESIRFERDAFSKEEVENFLGVRIPD